MNDLDFLVFTGLFKEAYIKCFRQAIKIPMTETESKIFCNRILEQTGLSIGWKSVKNYSFFIINAASRKDENPSTATLDTLARYVLDAPHTTEIQRKNDESHYPYWFHYRRKFQQPTKKNMSLKWLWTASVVFAGIVVIVFFIIYLNFFATSDTWQFTDDFHDTNESSMLGRGWIIKSKDAGYWNKRGEKPGLLTLYTLKGDNWPDPAFKPDIKNLLLQEIHADCFTAEVHLNNFIPKQEWQQAGILLLEDTSFIGKSIRLSLAFNDYFAGAPKPREILVQAITSLGKSFGKPEEIAHVPVLYPDSAVFNPLMIKNMENPALRIEKHGKKFRFLYSGGIRENGAFKEVATQEFDMKPKFIGIFAIKGFTNSDNIPVRFKFFRITGDPCSK
jgi:hypothetical protein